MGRCSYARARPTATTSRPVIFRAIESTQKERIRKQKNYGVEKGFQALGVFDD